MAINPTISDMKWLGEPADPVGNFQKGRNLAEQSQRMKQSADMHPLKMADMKSGTAARDANTNLSKQSYDFNELTKADRINSVNALSRMQQVSAGIAENTQKAVESLKNSQAWNQTRSDEVRKKVKVELEVQAKEAGHNRAITNQWVNEQTKQGQVDQFNQRTNLLGQQVRAATLTNDVNYANKTLMTEAQTAALQNQLNGFEVAQRKYELALQGRQPLQEGKLAMEGMSPDQLNALRPPSGLQPDQVTEWKNHRNALLDNFQGREYADAANAARAGRVKTYTSAQPYANDLTQAGLATVDQNGNLQIDPKNSAKVDMYVKQKDLLKDIPSEVRDRLLMQATETDDPVALFSETEPSVYGAVQGPLPAQSLAGKNAAIYGTKHGGEFVLNERGMSRLRPLVDKFNKERAFASDQAKTRAQLDLAKAQGIRIEGVEITPEGVKYTGKSGRMTSDQQQSAVREMYNALAQVETDAGREFNPNQLMAKARKEVFASTLPSASSAAELRGLGIREGVPYWNPIAKNKDGTVGGVRIAGEDDVNTGHNALGPLKGANAGGPPQPQGGGTDLSDIMQLTGMLKKKADLFKGDGQSGNNRDNRDAAPVLMQELTQYTTPEAAAHIIRSAYETGGVDYDPDKESALDLVEKVSKKNTKDLAVKKIDITKIASGGKTGRGALSDKTVDDLIASIGKPLSQWPVVTGTGVEFGAGEVDFARRLTAGDVAKLEPLLERYKNLQQRSSESQGLLRQLRYDASPPDESGRDSRYQSPSYADPNPAAPKPKPKKLPEGARGLLRKLQQTQQLARVKRQEAEQHRASGRPLAAAGKLKPADKIYAEAKTMFKQAEALEAQALKIEKQLEGLK